MKLTALEIRKHEFARAFRGYDAEEVDAFLNMVAQHWQTMGQDMQRLEERIEEQSQRIRHYMKVEEALEHALQNAKAMSRKTLDAAETQATEQVKEASEQAQATVREASARATELVRDAEEEARTIRQRAVRELRELERRLETARSAAVSELSAMDEDRTRFLNGLRSYLRNQLEGLSRFETTEPGPALGAFLASESAVSVQEADEEIPDPELSVSPSLETAPTDASAHLENRSAEEAGEEEVESGGREAEQARREASSTRPAPEDTRHPQSSGGENDSEGIEEDEEYLEEQLDEQEDWSEDAEEGRLSASSQSFTSGLPSADDGFEGSESPKGAGGGSIPDKPFGAEEEIQKIRRILEDLDS